PPNDGGVRPRMPTRDDGDPHVRCEGGRSRRGPPPTRVPLPRRRESVRDGPGGDGPLGRELPLPPDPEPPRRDRGEGGDVHRHTVRGSHRPTRPGAAKAEPFGYPGVYGTPRGPHDRE